MTSRPPVVANNDSNSRCRSARVFAGSARPGPRYSCPHSMSTTSPFMLLGPFVVSACRVIAEASLAGTLPPSRFLEFETGRGDEPGHHNDETGSQEGDEDATQQPDLTRNDLAE